MTVLIFSFIIKNVCYVTNVLNVRGVVMPPKAKYTKEEIVRAGLEIIRADGIHGLTARALGSKLGSSASPIFTVFQGMEEVLLEIVCAAKQIYTEYLKIGLNQSDAPKFMNVGLQYIAFASEEPKLFQILFMSEQQQKSTVTNLLPHIEDSYAQVLQSVQKSFNFNSTEAELFYRHLWIYTHGLATLYATNMCVFSKEEVKQMLIDVGTALIDRLHTNKLPGSSM